MGTYILKVGVHGYLYLMGTCISLYSWVYGMGGIFSFATTFSLDFNTNPCITDIKELQMPGVKM